MPEIVIADVNAIVHLTLPIPEGGGESLDPANQIAIAKHCKTRGVSLFTAEATDGGLRYKMFATE